MHPNPYNFTVILNMVYHDHVDPIRMLSQQILLLLWEVLIMLIHILLQKYNHH